MTVTSRGVRIPSASLRWKFTRSSGAGGQHVNTTDTRVELYCDVRALQASEPQMEMLLENLGTQVRVVESSRRSQLQNREAALERLSEIIDISCAPVRMRRATRPSRGAREARLRAKKIDSERKRSRRQPFVD